MRVAMIGATGLVGRNLWPLLEERHRLLVLGRRPSGAREERLGDMSEWPRLLEGERIDAAVSTLGTTWKKTGRWDRFAAVDRDAVLGFAKAAKAAGARQFLAISSVGADPDSRNRYLRLKGEVERELELVGFDRLDIVRPGLLIGERENDRRLMEKVGIMLTPLLNPLLSGPLDRYQGVDAALVARAMAALAGRGGTGAHRHQNREIRLASRPG